MFNDDGRQVSNAPGWTWIEDGGLQMIARRQFLAGLGATAVFGFDPVARSWITTAHAASPFDHVPALDGSLVMDAASLAAAAVDVGDIVHGYKLFQTPGRCMSAGFGALFRVVHFIRRALEQSIIIDS